MPLASEDLRFAPNGAEAGEGPAGSESDTDDSSSEDGEDLGSQHGESGEQPAHGALEVARVPQPPTTPAEKGSPQRSKQLVLRLKAALARRGSAAAKSSESTGGSFEVSPAGRDARRQSCGADAAAPAASMETATSSSSTTCAPASYSASPAARAAEWTARLQSQGDMREQLKACCRRIGTHIGPVVPALLDLPADEYLRLMDVILKEVEQLQQALAKTAYNMISSDWEELRDLRQLSEEVEDKMAQMTRMYLQEVAQTRDATRVQQPGLAVAMREIQRNVDYFEPLQYLRPEVRSTCLTILEEKIKAIFATDSSIQANVAELARFEDSYVKDKLVSYEKLNSKLRDEVRELRASAKKTDSSSEKLGWDLAKVEANAKQLTQDLEQANVVAAELRSENRSLRTKATKAVEEAAQAQSAAASINEFPVAAEEVSLEQVSASTRQASSMQALAKPAQVDASVQVDCAEPMFAHPPTPPHPPAPLPPPMRRLIPDKQRHIPDMQHFIPECTSLAVDQPGRGESVRCSGGGSDAGVDRDAGSGGSGCGSGAGSKETDEEIQALKTQLVQVEAKIKAVTAEKAAMECQLEELSADLDAARQELRASEEAHERMRKRLTAKMDELKSEQSRASRMLRAQGGSLCTEGVVAELEEQIRLRTDAQEALDQAAADLQAEKTKVRTLEEMLAKSRRAISKPGRSDKSAQLFEHNEMCKVIDQKARVQEQAAVHKAQLEDLIRENVVLEQSLEEMGKESHKMAALLRQHLPEHVQIESELSSVLAKMEVLAKSGGLFHLRLNKDARLREIAACTRASAARSDFEFGDLSAASDLAPVAPKKSMPDNSGMGMWPGSTRSQTSTGLGEGSSFDSPTVARTNTRTSIEPSFNEAGGVVTRIAGAQAPAQALPPVKVKRNKKVVSRTSTSLDIQEQCANLAVGSRGGFALLGGPASGPASARRTKTAL